MLLGEASPIIETPTGSVAIIVAAVGAGALIVSALFGLIGVWIQGRVHKDNREDHALTAQAIGELRDDVRLVRGELGNVHGELGNVRDELRSLREADARAADVDAGLAARVEANRRLAEENRERLDRAG